MALHVRRLREARGWSQADLASRYGCQQSYISQIEAGERGFGTDTMEGLSKAFGVSVPELWEMLGGVTTEDVESLGKKMAELRIRGKGEIFDRIVDILLYGSSEAVVTLDGISKVLGRTVKKGAVLPFPPSED